MSTEVQHNVVVRERITVETSAPPPLSPVLTPPTCLLRPRTLHSVTNLNILHVGWHGYMLDLCTGNCYQDIMDPHYVQNQGENYVEAKNHKSWENTQKHRQIDRISTSLVWSTALRPLHHHHGNAVLLHTRKEAILYRLSTTCWKAYKARLA